MPSNFLDKKNRPRISEIRDQLNKPEENFSEIVDLCRSYGQYLQETRFDTLSAEEKSLVKKRKNVISLKQDSGFREHIKTILKKENQDASQDDSQYSSEDGSEKPTEHSLLTELGLKKLAILITAWEDPYFRKSVESEDTFPSILYYRQHYKNKRFIDKSARHAIHAALFALYQTVHPNSDLDPKKSKESFEEYLKRLASLRAEPAVPAPDNEEAHQSAALWSETEQPDDLKNHIKSAEQALAAYRAPTKKNRAVRIVSIVLAILVGLVAGLGTGTALYLLVVGFPLWAAALLACATFAVGFYSNYLFFSETFPTFFQMIGRGELTQYIDKETGQRKKMGWFKKCLLGLALICALSVGLVSAVLLVKGIMAFSVVVLPALGAAPLIIGVVLGLIYCIGLTIAMFDAFVRAIKDPISFSEIKARFKRLTGRQILGLCIKLALSALVLFAIAFGCQVSVNNLMGMLTKALPNISVAGVFIAKITFDVAGILSFLGQVPFAFLAVNKLCDTASVFFKNLFRSRDYQNLDQVSVEEKKPKSLFYKILDQASLLLNAVGNAVLYLIPGSNPSKVAAVGAGIYSYSANLSEPPDDAQREKASDYSSNLIQEAWPKSGNVAPDSRQDGKSDLSSQEELKRTDPVCIPRTTKPELVNSHSSLYYSFSSDCDSHHLVYDTPINTSSSVVYYLPSSSYGSRANYDLQPPEEDNRSKLLPDEDIRRISMSY